MIYRVVEDGYETEDVDSVIEHCMEDDYYTTDDEYFEEWVNDSCSGVTLFGTYYSPYEILDSMGCLGDALDDYRESMTQNDSEEAKWELIHADPGSTVYIQNYTVELVEEIEHDTGDYDGDEDLEEFCEMDSETLERLRLKIESEKEKEKINQEKDKTQQNDYYGLFQTIGV